MAAYEITPKMKYLFQCHLTFLRYTNKTPAAAKLRVPVIAMGLSSTSLMKRPPMLHINAAMIKIPFAFIAACNLVPIFVSLIVL